MTGIRVATTIGRGRLPCLLLVTASAVGATDYLLDPHSERLPAWACWGIFLAAWATVVVSWRTHRLYLRRWSSGATPVVVLAEIIAVSYIHFNFFACPLRPNTPEEQQFVALTAAVSSDDLDRVQGILSRDKNPDYIPPRDYVTQASSKYRFAIPPVALAVQDGEVEIAEALLDHGASVTENRTLLATAARNNDIPMLRMLVAKGVPVNDFSKESDCGALVPCAQVQDERKGSSALWHAVEEQKVEAVAFLLAHRANPRTRQPDLGYESDYANVMQLARSTDNIPIAKLLKKAGATE